MPCQPTEVYIISHAHWDREWYQPFQGFRRRLVGAIDELLTLLEREPGYRYFWLDGQTIVLEDYLEIRPEHEPRLRQLIATGRIQVGPWYVQPDEALVSGESLIRNLLLGHRLAAAYGRPVPKVGYLPDIFGHISQLPQILAGFGIDNAFLWRGLHGEGYPSELAWEGADGTRTLLVRFGERDGYVDWFRDVREHFPVSSPEPDQLVDLVTRLLAYKAERATVPVVVAMDGADHAEPDPRLPEWLSLLQERFPRVQFTHSTPEQYLQRLRTLVSGLHTVYGELREPSKARGTGNDILNGVLSARIHLKQRNEICQTLLERWAEPAAVLAMVYAGVPYPRGYLRVAWHHLLQNHAHDSICGCSLDQVHQDMLYRFDQAAMIADETADEALRALAADIGVAEGTPGSHMAVVFNPNAIPFEGTALVDLELPAGSLQKPEVTEDPYRYFLNVYDADGRPLPIQLTAVHLQQQRRERIGHGVWQTRTFHRFTVAMPVRVPACGYASYTYERRDQPQRTQGSMAVGPLAWEGRWLSLSINPDGSINLLDKATGVEYRHLLTFEDVGDVGDGYKHFAPLQDRRVTSAGGIAMVAAECEGPLFTRLRLDWRLRVPASATPDALARSETEVILPITAWFDFPVDARELTCQVAVENTARDHALRALFPSGRSTDLYYTDSAFDLIQRSVHRPDYRDWNETVDEMVPQQSLVAIHDGAAGMCITSRGLPAVSVRSDPPRTVALTLLRGFARVIMQPGEGGQVLGSHRFRFDIVPFQATPGWEGRLCQRATACRSGLRTVVRAAAPGRGPRQRGFLSIEPADLQLSALKSAEEQDGLFVLRVYNPAISPIEGRVRFERAPCECWRANLNEEPGERVHLTPDGTIAVQVRPKKIVTLLMRW